MSDQQLVEMGEHAVRKAYARWAPIYDYTFGVIADAGRRRAVRHINSLPPSRVLEVGVGTGISLPGYRREHRIVGIDLSPEMLAKARERVAREGLTNVEGILEMDAAEMGAFEDGAFDVVVAMYVMTVVPDPVRVMRELERVCRPGGEVVVVNHFSQEKGLRGTLEKRMARFAEGLGWRPEFPKDTVMVCDSLCLVDEEPLKPFGLFTMLRFRKETEETAAGASLARQVAAQ